MATQIITNISLLANTRPGREFIRGNDLAILPSIKNAFIIIEDDIIAEIGKMEDLEFPNESYSAPDNTVVLPCWCDSHTHLVFAGSREEEFIDKINGLSYAEIAAKGGGILNSAKKLNEVSDDVLFSESWKRLEEVAKLGTGAVEIKSGYGLTLDGELKMLRVIKKLKEKSPLKIKSTFLGAHAFPLAYKENHKEYIDCIINEMLPVIAKERLADYIDVFCEENFFSPEEMRIICEAGKKYGLKPKLHVNQLNSIGGIEAGISLNALSLDHLETLMPADISLIGNYKGAATLLPSAAFFLRMPAPPARSLINAGAAVTLASDYNPGSSPSGNMNFVISLACIQMKMQPEEAINAATINGACAMEIENDYGTIWPGKKANLIFTKPISSLAYIFYSFGNNLIDKVVINGSFI
ncbi:MAG: imidazolonepropionase [Bacteroidota bacterium]|nr:imidazolonepropionase [Bacteroidota bacterium]